MGRVLVRRLPWVVFVGGAALVVATWWPHRVSHERAVALELGVTADLLVTRAEDYVADRVRLLGHLESQWNALPERDERSFVELADTYRETFAGFQAINRIDAEGRIVTVVPYEGNEAALHLDLADHAVAGPHIRRALGTGEPAVTPCLELAQGGLGFAVYHPIRGRDGAIEGAINGVFRAEPLLRAAVGRLALDRFRVEFRQGETMPARFGAAPADEERLTTSRSFEVGGVPWSMSLGEPRPDGRHELLLLLLGLATAGALGWVSSFGLGKRREAAEAERRYRLIVDNAREGVWLLDAEGRTTFVNDRMAEIFGERPEAMLGRSYRDWIDAESRARADENFAKRRSGLADSYDFRFRRRDGAEVWTRLNCSPVVEGDGSFQGALAMVSDITERRRLEEQLRHAQKMDAMGRLASGVAHDFNNLLTVVLGASELLESELEEGTGKRLAREIRDAARRGANLTSRLLAFGRKESTRSEVVDLAAIVEGMRPMLLRTLGEGVVFALEAEAGAPPVEADPGLVEQVLMNLAFNARDASPRGGRVEVEVRTARPEDLADGPPSGIAGPATVLEVRDEGPGVPDEIRDRIFEPFYTTKAIGEGTGLGLSIVAGFARQCGGFATVLRRAPERGSIFRVVLPAATSAVAARRDAVEAPPPRGRRERVLLVEDESAVRAVLAEMLEELGYEALPVAGAEQALEVIGDADQSLDVLLSDVVMPGIRGEELVLRARALRPELSCVLMSAAPTRGLGEGASPSGVLIKPFRREDLARALQRPRGS